MLPLLSLGRFVSQPPIMPRCTVRLELVRRAGRFDDEAVLVGQRRNTTTCKCVCGHGNTIVNRLQSSGTGFVCGCVVLPGISIGIAAGVRSMQPSVVAISIRQLPLRAPLQRDASYDGEYKHRWCRKGEGRLACPRFVSCPMSHPPTTTPLSVGLHQDNHNHHHRHRHMCCSRRQGLQDQSRCLRTGIGVGSHCKFGGEGGSGLVRTGRGELIGLHGQKKWIASHGHWDGSHRKFGGSRFEGLRLEGVLLHIGALKG